MSDQPRVLTPTPYGRHLGFEVLEAHRGIASVRLELAEHICNRRGVAHGGALASLLDSALGAAVISAAVPRGFGSANRGGASVTAALFADSEL